MKARMIKADERDLDLTLGKVYKGELDHNGNFDILKDDIGEANSLLKGQFELVKPKKDPIVKSVLKKYKQRSKVGIEKYGCTLERTDLSILDWIDEAQSEAMDFTVYLERLKQEVKKIEHLLVKNQ